MKRTLPIKRRKDAVLAIEYMITASPEVFIRHGGQLDDTGDGYFADALKWLQARHGRANVISATVHLDESTPHMVAYVVPLTPDKRLSCRDFLGGPAKLRAMQSDFHVKIGAPRSLERGVESSKAQHEAVSSFYATMKAANLAPDLKPRDYASAALGFKTDAWRQAEALAKSNAVKAARETRTKKSTEAKAKALQKRANALEKKAECLSAKEIMLRGDSADLEKRSRNLSEREREAGTISYKIFTLTAERDALERRLEQATSKPDEHKKAPWKGLDHHELPTLG